LALTVLVFFAGPAVFRFGEAALGLAKEPARFAAALGFAAAAGRLEETRLPPEGTTGREVFALIRLAGRDDATVGHLVVADFVFPAAEGFAFAAERAGRVSARFGADVLTVFGFALAGPAAEGLASAVRFGFPGLASAILALDFPGTVVVPAAAVLPSAFFGV
jgi:hypothetical protein